MGNLRSDVGIICSAIKHSFFPRFRLCCSSKLSHCFRSRRLKENRKIRDWKAMGNTENNAVKQEQFHLKVAFNLMATTCRWLWCCRQKANVLLPFVLFVGNLRRSLHSHWKAFLPVREWNNISTFKISQYKDRILSRKRMRGIRVHRDFLLNQEFLHFFS